MKLAIKKASVDVSLYVFIADSSVTTGAGKTGLVFNTASLVCYYVRPLGNATALTLATQTVTGAHSDGGFVEVDATNMPGVYRLDLSDAIVATGANSVVVMLKGAANMAPLILELELVAYDPQDTVRLGLTALPNVASGSDGSLMVRGATQDVTLKSLTISNSAGSALSLSATGANGSGMTASGNGTGAGMLTTGGASGAGLEARGGATSGAGLLALGVGSGSGASFTGVANHGLHCVGGANSDGLHLLGNSAGHGLNITAGATGIGVKIAGGATSGDGIDVSVTSGIEIDADLTGNITGNLSGAVGSVTGSVGGNVAGSVASVVAGVTLAASAVQAIWDAATTALTTVGSIGKLLVDRIDAAISSRSTVTTAQVNTEVVDALATDTYAEPASVPAATASLAAKVGWLFALARNKLTQTATTQTLRNDADTGNIATSAHSDDGTTHTRGEWI